MTTFDRASCRLSRERLHKNIGIADTSVVADARFTDLLARDYRLIADSPALKHGVGLRQAEKTPQK